MINVYAIFAVIVIIIVGVAYIGYFYFHLGYELSNSPEVWAQLGDYLGGLLNPALSFISIILLIKSLSLQNAANKSLTEQLKNSAKTEKFRAFENLFFNLIDSQKKIYESFEIKSLSGLKKIHQREADAVIAIEDEIHLIRGRGGSDDEVIDYLERLDERDGVYNILRAFYILVKLIDEMLSDEKGFEANDRAKHYEALINFTDFTQLRLVLISVQFMDFPASQYIKSNADFNKVAHSLGLSFELY